MGKFSELKAAAEKALELGRIKNYKKGDAAIAAFKAAATPAAILALLAELEAKDKRIAELEAIRADAAEVFSEIGNELGCNPDNESIMMAIDGLKERLATPVRLPDRHSALFRRYLRIRSDYQSHPAFKADEVIAAIQAAGFTVEGDE